MLEAPIIFGYPILINSKYVFHAGIITKLNKKNIFQSYITHYGLGLRSRVYIETLGDLYNRFKRNRLRNTKGMTYNYILLNCKTKPKSMENFLNKLDKNGKLKEEYKTFYEQTNYNFLINSCQTYVKYILELDKPDQSDKSFWYLVKILFLNLLSKLLKVEYFIFFKTVFEEFINLVKNMRDTEICNWTHILVFSDKIKLYKLKKNDD